MAIANHIYNVDIFYEIINIFFDYSNGRIHKGTVKMDILCTFTILQTYKKKINNKRKQAAELIHTLHMPL